MKLSTILFLSLLSSALARPTGPSSSATKLVIDSYSGIQAHGSGAQPDTQPDRSAVDAARYLAKNIVAQGQNSETKIQTSYAQNVA
jgi:S-adenosylmethionine synthetase